MSLFRRGLASAAAAGARLTEKYVDEDLAAQRAKMLADLQFEGQKRLDEYQNSPERRGMMREQGVLDDLAKSDPRLTQAKIDSEVATLRGTAPARAEAESAIIRGTAGASAEREGLMAGARADVELKKAADMLPLEIKKAYAVADAHARASRTGTGKNITAKIADMEKALGRPLTEQEKLGVFGLAKAVPESEKTTIVDKITDPKTGNERTITRTVSGGRPAPDGGGLSEQQAHEQARAAIAAGAPADAVNKRLQDAGFPPLSSGGGNQAPAAARKPLMERSQSDPLKMMSVRDLERVSAIDGHANQKAAMKELERRKAEATSSDADPGYSMTDPYGR